MEVDFVTILGDVLSNIRSPDVWSCKALSRVVQEICGQDPYSLTDIVYSLVEVMSNMDPDQVETSLTGRKLLHVWLNSSFAAAFKSFRTDGLNHRVFQSILTFLMACGRKQMHCSSAIPGPYPSDQVPNAIVCMATFLLSAASSILSPTDLTYVVNLLREVEPTAVTHTLLITTTFSLLGSSPEGLWDCQDQVRQYAQSLRVRNLFRLEASLWACALRQIDAGLLSVCGREAVKAYHSDLMDLVDEAEKRCFGPVDDTGEKLPDRHAADSFPKLEWEWEPIVGSYVGKSNSHSPSTKRTNQSLSPPGRSSKRARSCSGAPPQKRCRLMRSSSNFSSLLSDALSQRIVLHRDHTVRKGSFERDKRHDQSESNWPCGDVYTLGDDPEIENNDLAVPSSDDFLNLFVQHGP